MKDTTYISNGFIILEQYDGGPSEVNTDGISLYAGPGDRAEEGYTVADRELLEANYWFFDNTIGRWGYPL